jgi:hypothetical protein
VHLERAQQVSGLAEPGPDENAALGQAVVEFLGGDEAVEPGEVDVEDGDVRLGAQRGLERGLLPLALLCLRIQHDRPVPTDDGIDRGPYEPWARPLVPLDRGDRGRATKALRDVPDPPRDLLYEALWCLTARAAIAMGDHEVMQRALTELSPGGRRAGRSRQQHDRPRTGLPPPRRPYEPPSEADIPNERQAHGLPLDGIGRVEDQGVAGWTRVDWAAVARPRSACPSRSDARSIGRARRRRRSNMSNPNETCHPETAWEALATVAATGVSVRPHLIHERS